MLLSGVCRLAGAVATAGLAAACGPSHSSERTPIEVTISAKGKCSVSSLAVDCADVGHSVLAYRPSGPYAVVIRADPQTAYTVVGSVLQSLQDSKISPVTFASPK